MMAELQNHLDKRNEEFHNLTGSSQIEINELKSSLESKIGEFDELKSRTDQTSKEKQEKLTS